MTILLPSLSTIGIAAVIALIVYSAFAILSDLFSPLSRIPRAHWSSGYSPFWILLTRWRGEELPTVHNAHQKLGPVVRLGPKDLSIACYDDGVRKVYGGSFEKPGYYDFFSYYGKPNSFSSRSKSDHTYHRKRAAGVYTKSTLFESTELAVMTRKTLYSRFIPYLMTQSKQIQPTELLESSYSLCLDLVTQFIFGYTSASNFIEAPSSKTREWLEHYEKRYCPEAFWIQELPNFTNCLRRLGFDFLPSGFTESTEYLENWMIKMCKSADAVLKADSRNPEDTPIVYQQVKAGQEKFSFNSNPYENNLAVASELFDHMSGAREVLGLVVAYTIYYISRHPSAQEQLRAELSAAGITMKAPSGGTEQLPLPPPSSLDKLPYLAAVLQESFRLRPNSTPLPRVTPHDRSVSLGGYDNIPPSTRVNTFQWLIHRDPAKWEAVDEWRPERWLSDGAGEPSSESRVWAFGSGSRICIGVNFTHYIMRYILVAIFTNFRTTVVDHASFGQFAPGSLDDKLFVQFTPL